MAYHCQTHQNKWPAAFTDPAHPRAGKVGRSCIVRGMLRAGKEKGRGQFGAGRGRSQWQQCVSKSHPWFFQPTSPHSSPWTSKIAGMGPRGPIGNQATYQQVSKSHSYLPLLGCLIIPPPLYGACTLLVWLHDGRWWGIGLGWYWVILSQPNQLAG